MKRIFLIIILFLSALCLGQNATISQPVFRATRTAPLNLTTSWQTIDFNGTTGVQNTYGIDPISGNRMLWWDSTAKKFNIISDYDKNIAITLLFSTSVTSIGTPSRLEYRIVIPNGLGSGVDDYLPGFNNGKYGTVSIITTDINTQNHPQISGTLPANSVVRANGFYVQVRISASLALGSATLNECIISNTSNF